MSISLPTLPSLDVGGRVGGFGNLWRKILNYNKGGAILTYNDNNKIKCIIICSNTLQPNTGYHHHTKRRHISDFSTAPSPPVFSAICIIFGPTFCISQPNGWRYDCHFFCVS